MRASCPKMWGWLPQGRGQQCEVSGCSEDGVEPTEFAGQDVERREGRLSCPDWSGKTQGTDRQGLGRGELGVFGGTSRGDIDEAEG